MFDMRRRGPKTICDLSAPTCNITFVHKIIQVALIDSVHRKFNRNVITKIYYNNFTANWIKNNNNHLRLYEQTRRKRFSRAGATLVDRIRHTSAPLIYHAPRTGLSQFKIGCYEILVQWIQQHIWKLSLWNARNFKKYKRLYYLFHWI